jgi:protein tyrosine phosphatase type 4A
MHFIKCNNITFCVFPSPTNKTVNETAELLKSSNIYDIVHLTEIEYDKTQFTNTQFHNLIFEDGGFPDNNILTEWFKLLDYFNEKSMNVGIHCKASLGRAPLLIAIGLIYFNNISSEDAVFYIRNTIKNAINTKQIHYLNKNSRYIKKMNKIKKSSCVIC